MIVMELVLFIGVMILGEVFGFVLGMAWEQERKTRNNSEQ